MNQKLSELREAAHSGMALLGVVAASGSSLLLFLHMMGVNGIDVQVTQFTGVCGGVAALLSKLIDSANNAVTSANSVPNTVVNNLPPLGPQN